MKVALIRDAPGENWPSMDVYASNLAEALRRGVQTMALEEIAIAPRLPARLVLPFGKRVLPLGLYAARWLQYPARLARTAADVYHIADNSYGHLAYFLDPRRTVVTYHSGGSGIPRRLAPLTGRGPAHMMYRLAFLGMLRAARIIAVSHAARDELLSETSLAADRVTVVHHGLDPAFRPDVAAARRLRVSLLRKGDAHLLLHVGNAEARKNRETLYRALAVLRERGLAVRLVQIGGAPTPAHDELLRAVGVAGEVQHLAHVANRDLPAYYGAVDALMFPSLYEGFGLPLIEAMACGTPVVCSDIALFREICGPAAVYFDPASAIGLADAAERILTRSEQAADLRDAGLRQASNYTWTEAARQTESVYSEVHAGSMK